MSVRVVARIRPLLKLEYEKDIIVTTDESGIDSTEGSTAIRIPNPKNEGESFSFQFNSVYDQDATQQEIFDHEVAPTVKHLFKGFDITLFAYGVTGTGKTHTMRGGKSLADRGVIPRLLSSVYRRSRKVEKDSGGSTNIEVAMSYYEIYNDRVYDLFEPPEKRTAAGLPIRDSNGRTVVVGLTERPCSTLKEFEQLYDQANVNRSTSATKLNAHSSRSHAVLCVKLTQTSADRVLISTASAIDLAGSEDNRRTDNNKERMVESASINKSLFVLAQCVEAIAKKQNRIPYRESKMTRILSLGQNNGLTVMILNLAPVRSYHLDTLSSLNFANRTKKIEVNEIENEPIFRGPPAKPTAALGGQMINRQPLRQLTATQNIIPSEPSKRTEKPVVKTFSVYPDKGRPIARPSANNTRDPRTMLSKRPLESNNSSPRRPRKAIRPSDVPKSSRGTEAGLSKAEIEELIERRVDQKLAEKALSDAVAPVPALSGDLQKRLDALEQRVAEKQDSEGLQYLLMAKQHQARGEDASALKMYQLAQPFFPNNGKLANKINNLQDKLQQSREPNHHWSYPVVKYASNSPTKPVAKALPKQTDLYDDDHEYQNEDAAADDSFVFKSKSRKTTASKTKSLQVYRDVYSASTDGPQTPRTQNLLKIINTRDVSQIKLLKGVGSKKAENIVSSLCEMGTSEEGGLITDLEQLGCLKGVGWKTVENMRSGLGLPLIGEIDF